MRPITLFLGSAADEMLDGGIEVIVGDLEREGVSCAKTGDLRT